jgi:hypothetical protein
MFSFRQSSDPDGDPENVVGQLGGGVVAARTSGDQIEALCGGFQRRPPTGDAANGTPRNEHEAPLSIPCTSPPTVVTRQGACRLVARTEECSAPTHAAIDIVKAIH